MTEGDSEQGRSLRGYVLNALAIVAFGLWAWITWETYRRGNMGFARKTYWEWMDLLLVPAALALAGLWFSRVQKRDEELRETQKQLRIEQGRREESRRLMQEAHYQELLNNYIDKSTTLALEARLGPDTGQVIKALARTHTVHVLGVLDSHRNRLVAQFLRELELVHVLSLARADLAYAQFSRVNLTDFNLSEANLLAAVFSGAVLVSPNLVRAHLSGAYLTGADMRQATLNEANLIGAELSGAVLHEASLIAARLNGANLEEASLYGANLVGARFSSLEQLDEAILGDTTMPDGVILQGPQNPDGPYFAEWAASYEAKQATAGGRPRAASGDAAEEEE